VITDNNKKTRTAIFFSHANRPISIYSNARDWLLVLSTELRLWGIMFAEVW